MAKFRNADATRLPCLTRCWLIRSGRVCGAEAALVGIPTVATDIGGVRDAFTAMSVGVCVPADDFDGFIATARAVAADPGRYWPDRDTALEHHAIEAVADRWEQVLLQVGE